MSRNGEEKRAEGLMRLLSFALFMHSSLNSSRSISASPGFIEQTGRWCSCREKLASLQLSTWSWVILLILEQNTRQYKRFTSSAWFGYLVNWIPVWDAQDDAANTWSTAPSSRFSASSLIFDFPRKVPFFACRLLHFILLLHHRKQTNFWEECLTKDSFTCIPFTFPSSLKCRFVQNVHLDLAEQDLIWLLLVFFFPRESWCSLWNRYVFLRCAYVVAPHVEGIFSFSTTIMPQSSAHLLLLMNLILFLSSNDSNKKSDKVC